jgi:hypothetical protein
VETGDRRLGRSGSGMWKAGTSKVVAPTCVGSRLMGWPPRASIERTDRILVYGSNNPISLSSTEAWLKPTASLTMRGEKLGGDL